MRKVLLARWLGARPAWRCLMCAPTLLVVRGFPGQGGRMGVVVTLGLSLAAVVCLAASVVLIRREPRRMVNGFLIEAAILLLFMAFASNASSNAVVFAAAEVLLLALDCALSWWRAHGPVLPARRLFPRVYRLRVRQQAAGGCLCGACRACRVAGSACLGSAASTGDAPMPLPAWLP